MAAFLWQFFSTNAWDHHIKFLCNLRKHPTMMPQQLLMNLQLHNIILSSLPGAPINGTPTKLTNYEIKSIFYEAHPEPWKRNFNNADLNNHVQTIVNIMQYMVRQAEHNPFIPTGSSY
jgi:hypothetical protein